jgi:hypothetical protein
MKTTQLGVLYWDDSIPLPAVLEEAGTIDGTAFLNTWRGLPQETVQKLGLTVSDIEATKARLGAVHLFVLAHRPVRCAGGGRKGGRGWGVWGVRILCGGGGGRCMWGSQQG